MRPLSALLVVTSLAVASLANAQVSDSTAIAGISGGAPTLDCGSGQVKVGSVCNMTVTYGAAAGGACSKPGWISFGVNAAGDVFSCSNGAWKSLAASAPPAQNVNGCAAGTYQIAGYNASMPAMAHSQTMQTQLDCLMVTVQCVAGTVFHISTQLNWCGGN